jgi:hypothetical protein
MLRCCQPQATLSRADTRRLGAGAVWVGWQGGRNGRVGGTAGRETSMPYQLPLRCARAVPRGRGEQDVVSRRGETDEGRGETLEKRSL